MAGFWNVKKKKKLKEEKIMSDTFLPLLQFRSINEAVKQQESFKRNNYKNEHSSRLILSWSIFKFDHGTHGNLFWHSNSIFSSLHRYQTGFRSGLCLLASPWPVKTEQVLAWFILVSSFFYITKTYEDWGRLTEEWGRFRFTVDGSSVRRNRGGLTLHVCASVRPGLG